LGNTAALMMIRKNTFEKIGGFDESLRHCFEDVLLNLKLTVSGYSNYYSPDSVAYHLESASRDIKTTNNEMIQDYNNILVPYIKNNFEKLKKFVLIN
jgi:GT2 family glycosyltransferase